MFIVSKTESYYKSALICYACTDGSIAFRYIDLQSGQEVTATTSGSQGNTYTAVYHLCGDKWPGGDDRGRVLYSVMDGVGVRAFKRLTDGWQHAGCTGKEIANFITRELANPTIEPPRDSK